MSAIVSTPTSNIQESSFLSHSVMISVNAVSHSAQTSMTQTLIDDVWLTGINILWSAAGMEALVPLLCNNSVKLTSFISFGQLDLLVKEVLRSSLLIVIWLTILLWFLTVLSSSKLLFLI